MTHPIKVRLSPSFRVLVAMFLLLLAFPAGNAAANSGGEGERGPAVSVVERALLEGSFASGLELLLSGRATPRMPTVDILRIEGATPFDCNGNALLSRRQQTLFQLTPSSTRFSLRCKLKVHDSNKVSLEQLDGVLFLESAVRDGEFFANRNRMDLVRRVSDRQVLPITASGRYRLELKHGPAAFQYDIELRNPNRSPQTYRLKLASNEQVQRLDVQASWELADSTYHFELPPGPTHLSISGTLPEAFWMPPIEAARQHVLIESHPLLEATFASEGYAVSPEEAGYGRVSRGARAFVISGGQTLAWELKETETLPTTSFAVNSASHVLFVGAEGELLGSSTFEVNNQGAPALVMPMNSKPLYAGIASEPSFLTRDEAGNLRLPLGRGEQTVEVQYSSELKSAMGLVVSTLDVAPKVAATVSQMFLELRYPEEWIPLYQSVGGSSESVLSGLAWLLLLAIWVERCLYLLKMGKARIVMAALATLGVQGSPMAATVLVGLLSIVSLMWLLGQLRRFAPFGRFKGVAVAFVLGVLALAALGWLNDLGRAYFASTSHSLSSDFSGKMAPRSGTMAMAAREMEAAAAEPDYRGLPAKVRLPYGDRHHYFSNPLVPPSEAVEVRIVLISKALWGTFVVLIWALLIVGLYREREKLSQGFRGLAAGLGQRKGSDGDVDTGASPA